MTPFEKVAEYADDLPSVQLKRELKDETTRWVLGLRPGAPEPAGSVSEGRRLDAKLG